MLDEGQKDRIKYLKSECISLLLSEFESNKSIIIKETSIHQDLSSNAQLHKMLARSLDLLCHDKIESFEVLSQRIKLEYPIDEAASGVSERLSDLVFATLIREALMDHKLLLKLDLDKSKARPYEEVIDFSRSLSHDLKTSFVNQNTQVETNTEIVS